METLKAYKSHNTTTNGEYRDMTIEELYCLVERKVKAIYEDDTI